MKKPVIIVRHGQTESNVAGIAQGWTDSPLTRKGAMQGMALRKWMDAMNLHYPRIYTSDLGRAVQTAMILQDDQSLVYGVPGLREITFGSLDGKGTQAFDGVNWEKDYEKYGGESDEQAAIRGWKALIDLLNHDIHEFPDDDSPLLVVTHGAILYGMYIFLAKNPDKEWPDELQMHNCQTLICSLDLDTGKLELQETWYPNI